MIKISPQKIEESHTKKSATAVSSSVIVRFIEASCQGQPQWSTTWASSYSELAAVSEWHPLELLHTKEEPKRKNSAAFLKS